MKIYPFVELGNIFFNSNKKDIRAKVQGEFRTFEKVAGSGEYYDSYSALGMHLYYDSDDCLEFIETFKPCVAEYDGAKLIQMSSQEVESYFHEKSFIVSYYDEGFDVLELGISIYAPDDKIEAVAIFRKEYLDELEFDD